MKKSSLKNKFLTLTVLATVMGGSVFMPRANAAKVNIVAQTSGGSYRTNIAITGVSQTEKDGAITLGNQINFGTYQQSLAAGSITQSSSGVNHDATYSASTGATFNTDPVAWIVVEKDTGDTSGRYTLVSTKVLDGGVAFDTADVQNWSSSSMRTWMNDTTSSGMLGKMFTAKEQALLQAQNTETYGYTSGETGHNGWDDSDSEDTSKGYNVSTGDKLWLLSVQELHRWFKNDVDTNPNTTAYPGDASASGKVPWGAGATDFAKSKGMWIETTGGVTAVDGSLNAQYFLRSPSSISADAVRGSTTFGVVASSAATLTYDGARPALQINLSSLIFTSKSSYGYKSGTSGETEYKSGKGSAAVGGDAVKLEAIGSSDTLDLTLYDAELGTVTTATTLELKDDDIKLGYSGSSTEKSVAGMLATGSSSTGYTPVAWGRLSSGSVSGTGTLGLGNVDANTEYSLLIFNEQGTGTSFIGDANTIGKVKKVSNKSELDITGSSNTYTGAITIGTGNKLTAKASQLTGAISNSGTLILGDGNIGNDISGTGTTYLKANLEATSGSTVTVNSDRNISGTLNGSNGTIDMTGDSAVKTLTIGTLTDTTNLKIDVDMSNFTADKLAVGTMSSATVNVSGINITKDIVLTDDTLTLPVDGSDKITYVTDSSSGTAGDATYQVGGAADGTVVVTNNYKYTFSKDTENGKLKYKAEAGDLTFKKFVEGTLIDPTTGSQYTSDPTTLSMVDDLANTGDSITTITMGDSQSNEAITVNLNGHNLTSAAASTITINSGKTFNLYGGNATTDGTVDANTGFSVAGTMNISGKTDVKGNITNEGTTTFAGETKAEGTLSGAGSYTNSGTMTVEDASKLQMTNGLENTGTLNLGNSSNSVLGANITGTGTTLVAGNVTNNDKTITQNNLNITGTFTTDASKLDIAEAINNSGNVTFKAGTLAQKVQGTGNITIDGDVTTNANYIATTGINKVESGKTLTFNGGTLGQKVQGAGNLTFARDMTLNADSIATTGTNEVTAGATLNFAGGTLGKNLTGSGTAEFNGTVGVADGVNLGTATNNVNGTLDLAGRTTTGTINFKNGSTLKVDGNQIIGTAAINVSTSANVESGSKLYVSNAVKDTPYKILAGNDISVNSWQTDAEMADGFKAAYGLKVDTSGIINDGSQFTIKFVKDATAIDNVDIGNLLSNASSSSALYKYVDTLSQVQPDRATQATVINTMANMNALANVQQGTQTVMAMATDALQTNMGTGSRPILGDRGQVSGNRSGNRYQGSGVRNVAANAKDSAAIEVVETGKADEVMPGPVVAEKQKYDKTVWANYIHSKKTIEGLKTGRLEQNSTIQYNGVTVGADLWSNAKGFGGLALTTATGKTNSGQDGASVKNDADYYGISLYQRYDHKDVAILFDLSYIHAKNDVTMSAAGTADVTAKPKSDAYSAGVKVEYPVKIGHSSQLTPYTGVRYTHVHTDKYDNSLGISNDIKDQNLVNIPVGVQLKTEYTTNSDWKFGHIFEGGYVWNVGNRQSEQRLGYMGVYDSIDFDVTGRGEYFLKTALTAKHKDTDFELGYRYTKGDNTKDNKWNFNVTYNFGNAKGLPYKSVLLGKIDLLESANKALRAENVELKAENVALKAENERLRALLRDKGV